ncbi:DUF2806 domain-containing protein [uncultured Odoribacter sp.]|uniref:DUF2806 domain-containing protein n=1 Tax=uncultured Odoribacter sp. TaxID=876416 RepID=UPI002586BD43|nr:DUF2806 domain-containing protein [uncultured Odoribacter sp.]
MGALIEINTDGLAKLGETICYGIGLAAFGRKKMANAEAYAAIKQAETETKVEFLKLKGQEEIAKYISARESRKINNVKSVVEKATSHFMEEEKVSNEPVNTNWTNRFFSIVEDISDETLQDIWGRILAGEVKQPNSFSLRTLDLLRNVTKEEAELFVKASKYYVEKNFICTEEFALSLHETLLLGETGFINSEELTKEWNIEPNSKLEIIIDRNTLIILHNDTNKKVWCQPSVKKLSKAGIEILSLVEKTDRNKFYKILTQFFKSNGVSRVFKHEIVEYGENCSYKSIGEELFG